MDRDNFTFTVYTLSYNHRSSMHPTCNTLSVGKQSNQLSISIFSNTLWTQGRVVWLVRSNGEWPFISRHNGPFDQFTFLIPGLHTSKDDMKTSNCRQQTTSRTIKPYNGTHLPLNVNSDSSVRVVTPLSTEHRNRGSIPDNPPKRPDLHWVPPSFLLNL